MKKRISFLAVLFILVLIYPITGRAKTYQEPLLGARKGRYIYYSCGYHFYEKGIMKYDIKTKKKKLFFSRKKNGEETNGFYSMSVKDNYLYCVWDQGGDDYPIPVICRISLNGAKCEELTYGDNPVIVGNRIFYQKVKKNGDWGYYATGETYHMNLDGSNKRKGKTVKINKRSADLYGTKTSDHTSNIKGYSYYIGDYGKTLYRKNLKTKKKKKIYAAEHIDSFYVLNGYMMILQHKEGYKYSYYIIRTNGKEKKKVWTGVGVN